MSHGSFEPGRLRFICLPIGSTFGKCVRANEALTIAVTDLGAGDITSVAHAVAYVPVVGGVRISTFVEPSPSL